MPSTTLTVVTDESGNFSKSEVVNPPGFWSIKVELVATLLSPDDTTVIGTLDVDAVNGGPSNQEKGFKLDANETFHLGAWKLSGGDNGIVVRGRTEPPSPNTEMSVRLDAKKA